MIEQSIYRKLVGKSLRGAYHSFSHAALEKGLKNSIFEKILEVGAGEGEHVRHVSANFTQYILTDINEPLEEIQFNLPNVHFKKANVEELEFSNNEFDRVITTCVLHHLNKPLNALNEIRRVTKQNGVISILLPSDPGLIFRIIRKITADRYLKKQGVVSIKFLRATEHRNHVQSLDGMIMHVFQEDSITKRSYPIRRFSWNFSLFTIYQIKVRHQTP